ncbi:hypothetical protein [Methanobrevibacter gottschalkii]|uniref:hypothetical protein n=1 Tax=Methanobrevibacter gottschalkii TaxID=190974 RepID=UPI0038D218E9
MYKAIEVALKFLIAALNYEASKHGKRSAEHAVNREVSFQREQRLIQQVRVREASYRSTNNQLADIAQRRADRASALASKINDIIK